jgi:hypothetical protein
MQNVFLCVVIVLLVLWLLSPSLFSSECGPFTDYGYASSEPDFNKGVEGGGYNSYLQNVALDPTIKEQHKEWIDNLQVNLQPRMYSIRDDCDDGETPRVGLLKKDYGNIINENQNISLPSGRTCTEGDGGNSRWGGYGIGLCPVQRSI